MNTTSVIILVLFILLSYSFYSHHYQGIEPFQNKLTEKITIDYLNQDAPISITDVPLLNSVYDKLTNKYDNMYSAYYQSIIDSNPTFESNINDLKLKFNNINNSRNNYYLRMKERPNSNRHKCLSNSIKNNYQLDNCNQLDSKQYFDIHFIKNNQDYLKHLDKGTVQDLDNLEKKDELFYPFHLIKSKRNSNCLTNYNVPPCGEAKGSLKIESCVPKKSKNQQWLLEGID